MVSDLTIRTLQASLWGLEERRRAAEDNIANVETPGFQASVVSFEDSLRDAVAGGRPARMAIDTERSTAPTRLNGNNVDVADQVTTLTDTALRHQLAVQMMNAKFNVIRTAIGG